jgi:FtsH-binding integral membrane protein
MVAVRHLWMFRTAAIVHLFFGTAATWRFGLTDYDPAHRPLGVGLGVLAVIVGVFLLKPAKFAIVLSAIGAAVIAVCAAIGAPIVRGPVILAFALVAIVFGLYAALAARTLFERGA